MPPSQRHSAVRRLPLCSPPNDCCSSVTKKTSSTTAIRCCSLQQHDEDFVFHVVTSSTLESGNWDYGENCWHHHPDIWKQASWKRRHVTLEYLKTHIRPRSPSVKDIIPRIRIYIIFHFPNFNRSWDNLITIITIYALDERNGSIPTGKKIVLLSGASRSTEGPPSLLVNAYRSPFLVTKQPWCKSGRLTLIKCRVKSAYSYTVTLP
jgi:hypothetical protein